MTKSGKYNPNWRGGKSVTSHGYVLVRVGKGHHLADVRGYAYEHRVQAEKKLGRRLEKGELIHHIDGDRANNELSNLQITGSIANHLLLHRKKESNRRLPDEKNEEVSCGCGCGSSFFKYDSYGRPREYVSGHNPQPAKTHTEILRALERGSMHRNQIARLCNASEKSVFSALSKLKKNGLIYQIGKGVWELCQK